MISRNEDIVKKYYIQYKMFIIIRFFKEFIYKIFILHLFHYDIFHLR